MLSREQAKIIQPRRTAGWRAASAYDSGELALDTTNVSAKVVCSFSANRDGARVGGKDTPDAVCAGISCRSTVRFRHLSAGDTKLIQELEFPPKLGARKAAIEEIAVFLNRP